MLKALEYRLRFSMDPNSGRRNRSWVKLAPVGEVIQYRGREVEFSQEYLQRLVAEGTKLNLYFDQKADEHAGEAYRFPVLAEHQPKGERYGTVLQTKVADKHGFHGLWAHIEWADDTLEAIELNKVKHVSMYVLPEYETEDGETYGPIIREVSITVDQYLNSIGSIQDTLGLQLSKDALTELQDVDEDQMEELLKQLAALTDQVSAIGARVAALEGEDPDDEEPEGEPETDTDEEPEGEESDAGADVDQDEDEDEDEEPEGADVVELDDLDDEEALAASRTISKALHKLSMQLGKFDARLEEVEKAKGMRLNTRPKGKQGMPPAGPKKFSSFDERVEHIMKTKEVSRSDATEMAFKATS